MQQGDRFSTVTAREREKGREKERKREEGREKKIHKFYKAYKTHFRVRVDREGRGREEGRREGGREINRKKEIITKRKRGREM
jgi:hypothetical protein